MPHTAPKTYNIVLLPGDSDAVEVHWPGGKISRTALSGSPRTIQIPHP